MKRPHIGEPVHYLSRGSADGVFPPVCRAAIVTEPPVAEVERIVTADNETVREVVVGQYVSLAVLNPTGLFFDTGINRDDLGTEPGSWHYTSACPNHERESQ